MMNDETANWAWVAGVFEGEGCFSITKRPYGAKHYGQILIGMTDLDVLEKVQALTGVGTIHSGYRKEGQKPIYRYQVGKASDMIYFVDNIMPWLCSRRLSKAQEFRDVVAAQPKYNKTLGEVA